MPSAMFISTPPTTGSQRFWLVISRRSCPSATTGCRSSGRTVVDRDTGGDLVVERGHRADRLLDAHGVAVERERRAVEQDVVDAAEIAADRTGLRVGEAAAVG